MKISQFFLLALIIFAATLAALLVWAEIVKKQFQQTSSGSLAGILGGILGGGQ